MQFLRDEASRGKYAEALKDFEEWAGLSDGPFYYRVRNFAELRDDTNPVLTYTIGTKNNQHHKSVVKWEEREVPLDEIFTCGINPCMRDDLNDVAWKLAAFARKHACKYQEFRLDEIPPVEKRRAISVQHEVAGKVGRFEILDGVHRCVALTVNGFSTVRAFVARIGT